jgi:hypothetical protein
MGFTACNDEAMDLYPETRITVPAFFKTTDDLKTYVNGLYNDGTLLSAGVWADAVSDNLTVVTAYPEQAWSIIHGTLSPETAGGWAGWGSLRSVNLLLNNLHDVTGTESEIRNYIGIARYMRAWFYFNKVAVYSDVPWYNKPLETDDPDVYKASDPRALVVDSIMADLEYAVANISADMGNKTRVHKYCALALLSRFSLYEGTYRKYHPELNLASTAERFLQRAVSAGEEMMNSGQFEITGGGTILDLGNGIRGSQGFRDLFCALDLSGNREIIQWVHYQYPNRVFHSGIGFWGLSRSLQESFLTADGSPFSSVAGYDRKTFVDVFVDRDPRMAESISYPGMTDLNNNITYSRPDRGGYDQSKSATRPPMISGEYGATQLYRYAEVLLNYAEAKAELGSLTQADIDKSINPLRDRVDMPHFDAAKEVDNDLRAQYPGITDNTLLAVRRERRVELACEGFRERDLYRWGAGKLFLSPQSLQGMYVELGLYDVTGDGINDYAILEKEEDRNQYSEEEQEPIKGWYYLAGGELNFTKVTETSGYIIGDKSARDFKEPQYYYQPIPSVQLILNPNLKQPYGW